MVLNVDIRHWLTETGEPHPRVRRQALRIARLIEYGGPLEPGQMRETLVECSRRPERRPCSGLLWVVKTQDGHVDAFCRICKQERVYISGWQETEWADGMMEPVDIDELPWEH
jgi:hypothetical protein